MAFRTRQFDARRGRLRATESLAGWVFADMLLVLFLVGIGTAVTLKVPEPEPEPEEPIEQIVGMNLDPQMERITVDSAGLLAGDKDAQKRSCRALKNAFSQQITDSDQAAFILIFAGGGDAGIAKRVSEKVEPQLHCASPEVFPKDTVARAYWDGKADSVNNVRVEVFFYIKQEQAAR